MLDLIPTTPNYRMSTVLDGDPFVLQVRWNARAATWFLDVLASDDTPIANGLALVPGVLIGRRVADARMPGCFAVSDLTGEGANPGVDDLGVRHVVHFYTFDELLDL
jgi:hypothetical protein